MKKLLIALNIVLLSTLAACGGGGSDSGAGAPDTFPEAFVGTFQGTINATATAAGISQSESAPLTITITPNAELEFSNMDLDETITTTVSNSGEFSLSMTMDFAEFGCSASADVQGQVDAAGNNVSGTLSGEAQGCSVDGVTFDADLTGDFSAAR